jgi:hypothetical protein
VQGNTDAGLKCLAECADAIGGQYQDPFIVFKSAKEDFENMPSVCAPPK